jgi:hypothetical protein
MRGSRSASSGCLYRERTGWPVAQQATAPDRPERRAVCNLDRRIAAVEVRITVAVARSRPAVPPRSPLLRLSVRPGRATRRAPGRRGHPAGRGDQGRAHVRAGAPGLAAATSSAIKRRRMAPRYCPTCRTEPRASRLFGGRVELAPLPAPRAETEMGGTGSRRRSGCASRRFGSASQRAANACRARRRSASAE